MNIEKMHENYFKIGKKEETTMHTENNNTQTLEQINKKLLKNLVTTSEDTINTHLKLLRENQIITQDDVLQINKILNKKIKQAKK